MERLSTGAAGLDEVMRGGLLARSLHLAVGAPGTGKTVLAQQIAFHHARRGSNVIFLTALSESIESLIVHAENLTFFDPSLVAQRLFYVSIFSELRAGGLSTVLDEIRRLVIQYKAKVLLLDGLMTLELASRDPLDFRRFIFTADTQLRSLGTTSVFLGVGDSLRPTEPEAAVADGIIVLYQDTLDGRGARFLEVPKLRSVPHLIGRNSFIITDEGITVYPRLEAALAAEGQPTAEVAGKRLELGIPTLDQMAGGGLPAGSATLVAGESGTGKTVVGLSFLAEGARRGEVGLYLGFNEVPTRLMAKGDGVGLDLSRWVQSTLVHLMWQPLIEPLPDELAWRLIAAVKTRGATRVVIDGFDDLLYAVRYPERLVSFAHALTNALRGLGVTTVLTTLPPPIEGPSPSPGSGQTLGLSIPTRAICTAADNVVLLRHVQVGAHRRRSVSILKMRESEYDSTTYEFAISSGGLQVTKPMDIGSLQSTQIQPGHRNWPRGAQT